MRTDLNICGKNYTQTIYVICLRSEQLKDDPNGWLHHHTYTDLEKAKAGLKKLPTKAESPLPLGGGMNAVLHDNKMI